MLSLKSTTRETLADDLEKIIDGSVDRTILVCSGQIRNTDGPATWLLSISEQTGMPLYKTIKGGLRLLIPDLRLISKICSYLHSFDINEQSLVKPYLTPSISSPEEMYNLLVEGKTPICLTTSDSFPFGRLEMTFHDLYHLVRKNRPELTPQDIRVSLNWIGTMLDVAKKFDHPLSLRQLEAFLDLEQPLSGKLLFERVIGSFIPAYDHLEVDHALKSQIHHAFCLITEMYCRADRTAEKMALMFGLHPDMEVKVQGPFSTDYTLYGTSNTITLKDLVRRSDNPYRNRVID